MRNYIGENKNALLLLIILPMIIFPWAFTGQSRFAGIDIVKLHQPMRFFDVQTVPDGELPLWNPNIFSGFPQFAEGESGFLYLGNLPQYLPVDFSYAYTIVILLAFAINGLLSFGCFRHSGLDKRMSLALAVVWTYSPFLMFHLSAPTILMVLGLYPALLHLSGSLTGKPIMRLGLIALLASQMIFIGSPQMAFFGFFSYFIYAGIRWLCSRKLVPRAGSTLILIPIAGIVLGGIIAAIQMLPLIEFLGHTARGAGLTEAFRGTGSWLDLSRIASILVFPLINESRELIHYGSSLLYVGLIPGLFFIGALIGGWGSNRIRTHLLTAIVLIILAMGTRLWINGWMEHIPPFDRFRYYGRFSGFALLHILIASGHWMHGLLARYQAGRFGMREFLNVFGAPLGLTAFLLLVYISFNGTSIFLAPGIVYFIVQLIVFVPFFSRANLRKSIPIVAAVFSLMLAYPLGNLVQLDTDEYKRTMAGFDELARERPGARFIIQGEGALISPDGAGPMFLTPYRTMKSFAGGNAASMSGINVLSGYAALKTTEMESLLDSFVRGAEDERFAALELLVPDYIITREEMALRGYDVVAGANLLGIADEGTLHRSIYRIPKAMFISDLPAEEAQVSLTSAASENMKNPGWVSEPESMGKGYVIRTDLPADGTLVVLDPWYPGWEAYVKGQKVEIQKFASLYKAVPVPAGNAVVSFVYKPDSVKTGFYISMIALLAAILLVAIPSGRSIELVK